MSAAATNRPLRALVVFLLLGVTLALYWPSLGGGFVVDDHLWATQPPPEIGAVFARMLDSWGFRDSALGISGPPIFRPVSTLLTGLEHWAFGASAFAYRLASLLVHCANGVLLYLLLGRLMPASRFPARAFAVAVFLLHPAVVEPVAWISSGAELYMSSFALLALICFLRCREGGGPPWRAAFVVAVALAVLSKEAALALPALLLLVQAYRRDRLVVFETIAAALIVAGYVAWRQVVIQGQGGEDALSLSPLRVLAFALAHLRYLLLPAAQPFSIAPPDLPVAGPGTLAGTGLVLVLLAGYAWRADGHARRALLLGVGWMLLALWPAYAIALVGDGFFAGRHAYLPAAGLSIVLLTVADGLPASAARRAAPLAALLLAYLGYSASVAATTHWGSNLAAYTRASALSPGFAGVWAGIGHAHMDADRPAPAQAAFERALAQRNSRRSEQEIRYALAAVLAQQGKLAQSDEHLLRLTVLDADDSSAWNGLGNNAWMRGDMSSAVRHYRRALAAEPANREAQRNLRAALQTLGQQ